MLESQPVEGLNTSLAAAGGELYNQKRTRHSIGFCGRCEALNWKRDLCMQVVYRANMTAGVHRFAKEFRFV